MKNASEIIKSTDPTVDEPIHIEDDGKITLLTSIITSGGGSANKPLIAAATQLLFQGYCIVPIEEKPTIAALITGGFELMEVGGAKGIEFGLDGKNIFLYFHNPDARFIIDNDKHGDEANSLIAEVEKAYQAQLNADTEIYDCIY